jgi:hypothetical protein
VRTLRIRTETLEQFAVFSPALPARGILRGGVAFFRCDAVGDRAGRSDKETERKHRSAIDAER